MNNVIDYLEVRWKQLTAFSNKQDVKARLWNELVEHYSQPNRYYHNLVHIANLFYLLEKNIDHTQNPALLGFAIFYHDVVYDTLRKDNEEQSAAMARRRLQELRLKPSFIEDVVCLIMATKKHQVNQYVSFANDMALFLDLDLAVLADDWNDYDLYRQNIRKEFKQHPEHIFASGRKHALKQILDLNNIYLSSFSNGGMEERARENLTRELHLL